MNILIIEYGSGYGGSSSYLYNFLKYLDRMRFNSTVVFYDEAEGPYPSKIKELGFDVLFLRRGRKTRKTNNVSGVTSKFAGYMRYLGNFIRRDIPAIIKLLGIINKNDIELMLLNQDVIVHIPGLFASVLARIPCVVRKGGVGNYKGRILRKMLSYIPDLFIASSRAEYDYHVKSNFPYKKMEVVYEGVDVTHYFPGKSAAGILSRFGVTPGQKVVVNISRFEEGKGHGDFIKAAELALKKEPETVFLIVGDEVNGREGIHKRIEDEVKKRGLSGRIVFTGWQNDTAGLLQAADIFVHCPDSWREGMGIATLEAMASAKPVIITNNWGLAETTFDGYNGFVVPIGDYAQIAEKLLLLLGEPTLRSKMGKNSRRRAEELFDISRNIKKIEEMLINYGN